MSLFILLSLFISYHEYVAFFAFFLLTGSYVACALAYCHLVAGRNTDHLTSRNRSNRCAASHCRPKAHFPADNSELV